MQAFAVHGCELCYHLPQVSFGEEAYRGVTAPLRVWLCECVGASFPPLETALDLADLSLQTVEAPRCEFSEKCPPRMSLAERSPAVEAMMNPPS